MKKLLFLFLFTCHAAYAETVFLGDQVPTNWRVQNYLPGFVVLWFTGSSCPSGGLMLAPTATPADHARLYATVMSAKIGNAKIFVYYDNSTRECYISSFGLS